jgi:rubrerythrin
MAIVNLGSFLDEIAKFEQSAEQYYADLRDRTRNDGVRLLTHYLARRKQHLPQAMSLIKQQDLEEARRFPVLLSEDQVPGPAFFAEHRLDDNADGGRLLAQAIIFTETLLQLYEKMVEMIPSGPAHGLFRTLTVIEQRAVVELKKILAMNYF